MPMVLISPLISDLAQYELSERLRSFVLAMNVSLLKIIMNK